MQHWKIFSRSAKATNCLLARWFVALFSDGIIPDWRFLEENVIDWQSAERKWIAYWREQNPDLCNVADGGNQWPGLGGAARKGQSLPEEHRERIRIAHLRENMSPEYRKNLSEAIRKSWQNGRICNREKIRASLLGKPRSAEAKLACSLGQQAMSPELKAKRIAQAATIAHTRWHLNRGVFRPETCHLCREGTNG